MISAYTLTAAQRERLTEAIQSVSDRPVQCEWREDAQVLAGIRFSLGDWILGANLQDELKFFVDAVLDPRPTHAA